MAWDEDWERVLAEDQCDLLLSVWLPYRIRDFLIGAGLSVRDGHDIFIDLFVEFGTSKPERVIEGKALTEEELVEGDDSVIEGDGLLVDGADRINSAEE
jgi:hypothetical protein